MRGDQLRGGINNAFLLDTMAGVILYRHLPPHEKSQVIARCRRLIAARLSVGHSLLDRILAVWGVTPDWGVWSMSNGELQQALKNDARLRYWLSLAEELGSGSSGLGGVWRRVARTPHAVPAAVIGLIIAGVASVVDFGTSYVDAQYGEELSRRQLLLTSKYYK